MPQLIMSIDEIARRKQRDVIYVEFPNRETGVRLDYRSNPSRKACLDLFTANDIPYFECGGYASDTGLDSYCGQIYVDVPFDENNPLFKTVVRLLGRATKVAAGSKPKLFLLTLLTATKNAHHDDPEFSWC